MTSKVQQVPNKQNTCTNTHIGDDKIEQCNVCIGNIKSSSNTDIEAMCVDNDC